MKMEYGFAEGSPGVSHDQVVHVIVLSRERTPDGMDIGARTKQRTDTAGVFFNRYLRYGEGVVVPTGNRTPFDQNGEPWRNIDGTEYLGVPLALNMEARLVEVHEIPPERIRSEPDSIDTVTNITNSVARLPDDGLPVGIVAHEKHLERTLGIIAEKLLRRPFVGIIAPDVEGDPDDQYEQRGARLGSRAILLGVRPEDPRMAEKATRNAKFLFDGIMQAQDLVREAADLVR